MTITYGYALSSEEHAPNTLVRNAGLAEQAGMSFASASDHFHPWVTRQGNSPLVWSVLGGIAGSTSVLKVGTGVTCPIMRIHPAIVAQAAATVSAMMPGRFYLGVGSGEALNEHVTGECWPPASRRLEMLEEAIQVIRQLWTGDEVTFFGKHFTVVDARIFTMPGGPLPIYVAASGPKAGRLAAENDGLIVTSPSSSVIEEFISEGGETKPRFGQVTVCWAKSESEGVDTVAEWWPNITLPGSLNAELPRPSLFDDLVENPDLGAIAKQATCGPDVEPYLAIVAKYIEAGIDHVYFHQVGPDQEGFLRFFQRELSPALASMDTWSARPKEAVPV